MQKTIEKKQILVVAAHPDDEVLGCGGLIKRSVNAGDTCYVLILTDGGAGRFDASQIEALKQNAIQANKSLGTTEVFFESLPNQALDTLAITEVAHTIEKYIAKLRPSVIYTHHNGDLNMDHRVAFEATILAARPLPGQCVKEIYSYNVPSSTEWMCIHGEKPFIPNYFVDILNFIDLKIAALRCYKSECKTYPHPRSPEAIKAHANYWGLTTGLVYVEPFKLIRRIEE